MINVYAALVATCFCTALGLGAAASQAQELSVTSPAQHAVVADTITISGQAPGYVDVEVWIGVGLFGRATPDATGAYSIPVLTKAMPSGAQTLTINAYNAPAGQPYTSSQQASLSLIVANGGNMTISSPSQNASVDSAVTIVGNALGYMDIEVSFDGTTLAQVTPDVSGDFKLPVNTSSLPAGTDRLVITANNLPKGQQPTWSQQFWLNVAVNHAASSSSGTSGPTSSGSPSSSGSSSGSFGSTSSVSSGSSGGSSGSSTSSTAAITVSAPTSNATVSKQITLAGSAPGFVNVEVAFKGILLGRATPDSSGAFQTTFSTASLPDGAQTLAINAWNSAAGQPYTATSQSSLNLTVANGSINIVDYGAIGDGVTDNLNAINSAIAAAKARGVAVFVPAGTFAFSNVITLTSGQIFGIGDQSVLYALDPANSSIFMWGTGTQVRQLKLTGVTPPGRTAPWNATHITIFGASNFVIDHVTIDGASAAGIQTAIGANNGIISNNTVSHTLSDSIHITMYSHDILVENNHVSYSGDDGIAVVSYLNDGGITSNITAINNVVQNNIGGRSMSVVGGSNVLYRNNLLQNDPAAAGIYIVQESFYNTYGDTNVTVQNNTVDYCGNPAIGHSAIMVATTGTLPNQNIQVLNNQVVQSSNNAGVEVFGLNNNVNLTNNEVTGAYLAFSIADAGIGFIPYTSGPVGYVAPASLPIP